MKVVIATDSYKGSLSTLEAGEAIAQGIKNFDKNIETFVSPLADGGEGTSFALTHALGGKIVTANVHAPLGNIVEARYGLIENRHLAVIEMAEASGLSLVPTDKRNPLYTSSIGTGEMILDAIKRGCRDFIIGIGGSATNDGGIGMLSALGYEFLNENNKPVPAGAIGLSVLAHINSEKVIHELKDCNFIIACDVNNPLCGPNGCSAIYGPQKGATPEMIKDMDMWLKNYAALTKFLNPEASDLTEGAGAAGGLGFAFLSYTNASLKPGIDIVLEETDIEEHIKEADLVITGEGRLDAQSVMGKAPTGIAKLAKKYNKKVIAIAGCLTEDAKECNAHGIDAFFAAVPGAVSLEEAMNPENAKNNIKNVVEQVFRAINLW